MKTKIKYKRILLKLTGELFGGKDKSGLDFAEIESIARKILRIHKKYAVEIALVVGSGNLFRGRETAKTNVERASADYIGMLATVMNALAMQEAIERLGGSVRVLSAITMQAVCEPYIRKRAIHHLEKKRIVIIGAGTGSPFFTTDSAAALRACELNCEIILKGSNVDGVYSKDPKKDKTAKKLRKVSYQQALKEGLHVMDNTAFALCQREKIPIIIFDGNKINNINQILRGKSVGTIVK